MRISNTVALLWGCALVGISLGYSLRNQELPVFRVVVVPANSRNPSSEEETVLQKPNDSKLLVGDGEEIPLNSKLIFECNSPNYPLQIVYSGNGMPEYTTNTSQSDNRDNQDGQGQVTKPKLLYEAQLFLGYSRSLGSYDSGRYTCRSLQDSAKSSSYYLFVSDGKLFVRPEGDTIYFRRSDSSVRIPCSVTNPKTVVSLQKSVDGLVQCPLNDSISYDPASGFLLKISNRFDVAGTYVCTAGHKGVYQAIQYTLVSDEPPNSEPQRLPCRRDVDCPNNEACLSNGHCGSPCSSSCGQNTSCRTVNHLAHCKCLPGYSGDPIRGCQQSSPPPSNIQDPPGQDPCHPYPCGQNTVCENRNGIASCSCAPNYQGDPYYRCYRKSTNPCDPNPCGPNSHCRASGSYASCSCAQGYIGTPPNCRPECQNDYECHHSQVCRQYRCRNPCEGACNDIPNTQCRVINRRPVCARVQNRCPIGYYGRDCSKIYEKEEAEKAPTMTSSEQISPCTPSPCGQGALCSVRMMSNMVLNETGDIAYCHCPPGKTGNADVECFALDEFVIVTHEDLRHDLSLDDEEATENAVEPFDPESTSPVPTTTTTTIPTTSTTPTTTTTTTTEVATTASTTTTTTQPPIPSTKFPKKCGINGITIISPEGDTLCTCPIGFTGIPSIECHALNHDDPNIDNDDATDLTEPVFCDSANSSISCGVNAQCVLINGTEKCRCMNPFKGNPDVGCELECTSSDDCPQEYTCSLPSGRCVDPCSPSLKMFFKQCGRDALCRTSNHTSTCYCPKDLPHGNPDVHCKEKSWMPSQPPPSPLRTCETNHTCGANSECKTFHDLKMYCVCKPGFYGDPYQEQGCEVGLQCRNSSICPDSKECVNHRCLDPCRNKELNCGKFAGCVADQHKSRCVCNIGAIRMSPNGPCEPVMGALAERMALFRSFEDFKK